MRKNAATFLIIFVFYLCSIVTSIASEGILTVESLNKTQQEMLANLNKHLSCGLLSLLYCTQESTIPMKELNAIKEDYPDKILSLLDLKKIANRLNFEFTGFNVSNADSNIFDKITEPWIAHYGDEHYVVVDNHNGDILDLYDPYIGCITISNDEFLKNWTGYGANVTPSKNSSAEIEKSNYLGLTFSSPIWNMGEIRELRDFFVPMLVCNTTREEKIFKVESSCSCFVIENDQMRVVGPGETTSLAIRYKPQGLNETISKQVYVASGDSQVYDTAKIVGKANLLLSVAPRTVRVSLKENEFPYRGKLLVVSPKMDEKIKFIVKADFSIETHIEKVEYDEIPESFNFSSNFPESYADYDCYIVDYTLPGFSIGKNKNKLELWLKEDDKKIQEVFFDISVNRDVSIEPEILYFEKSPEIEKNEKQQIVIRSGDEYSVDSLVVEKGFFEIFSDSQQKITKIDVTVNDDVKDEFVIQDRLVVEFNSKDENKSFKKNIPIVYVNTDIQ